MPKKKKKLKKRKKLKIKKRTRKTKLKTKKKIILESEKELVIRTSKSGPNKLTLIRKHMKKNIIHLSKIMKIFGKKKEKELHG